MADIASKLGLPPKPGETETWGDEHCELSYTVLDPDKNQVLLSLSLAVEGMPDDLWLNKEGYGSALMAARGLEEIQVGEADFDDAFWLATLEPDAALAWLTPERRELLLSVFLEKEMHLLGGRIGLHEMLTGPTLEAAERAREVLRRTRELLQHPPPLSPGRAPRDINRRQRAGLYRPLLCLAAVCAGGAWLVPGFAGQAGLGCVAIWLGVTAAAWWQGRRVAYPLLKVSRWLLTVAALALVVAVVWWQVRQGKWVDAFFNATMAGLFLWVGHYLVEMRMIAASRIRLR